ncbi:MAG: TOBE domain-containing protein [Campylobacterota bacterium]
MNLTSNLTLELSNQPFLLEKRIELLKAIKNQGSISKAAKSIPMSYKAAWDAISDINNLSSSPIVSKETGGKGGGGTSLTPYGQKLLKTYEVLKSEQKRFLQNLESITDFDTGTLKTIERFAMQISARNQISGVVKKIVKNDINANIVISTKSKQEIFANISYDAVKSLDIKENDSVIGIFKSNNVLLATSDEIAISARNKIKGKIVSIKKDNTNSEVTIDINNSETITSIITTGAVKKLGLEIKKEVFAFIKSSDIIIGK